MQAEDNQWAQVLVWLRAKGVTLDIGLSKTELQSIENEFCFQFPEDLKSLLSLALPTSHGFPDWRHESEVSLRQRLDDPFKGIAFDIQYNQFWHATWGDRPLDLSVAVEEARVQVAKWPPLLPIYKHRYLPAEPILAGNPVFSVHQTDIIYYGSDLLRYFACEFGDMDYATAVAGEIRKILFWSEFTEG